MKVEKMYIEALKNSCFKEEFTYLEPKKIQPNINNNNLYKDKETTNNCNIKVLSEKLCRNDKWTILNNISL